MLPKRPIKRSQRTKKRSDGSRGLDHSGSLGSAENPGQIQLISVARQAT